MEDARFWQVIEDEGASERIVATLRGLPPEEIAGFHAWLWAYYVATYRYDLWAAASAIVDGVTDDHFDYFRCWLIGRGRSAVESAIRDPEALASIIGDEPSPYDFDLLGVAEDAYPGELGEPADVAIPGTDAWPEDRVDGDATWSDDFYAATFPLLYERYVLPRRRREGPAAISEERFWAIIKEAAVAHGGLPGSWEAEVGLEKYLCTLPVEQVIGFDRWFTAYDNALKRDYVRELAATVLLHLPDESSGDGEGTDAERGAEASSGSAREAFDDDALDDDDLDDDDLDDDDDPEDEPEMAAPRAPDPHREYSWFRNWLILMGRDVVHAMTHAPTTVLTVAGSQPRRYCSFMTMLAKERLGIHRDFEPETIPDLHTWIADTAVAPARD